MVARIRPEDAAALMRSKGLEPLEPYTDSRTPWRCRCTTCGNEVSLRYKHVREGRGCPHCYQASRTGTPRAPYVIVRRDDAAKADLMRGAGLEPLTAYQRGPWPCLCLACGRSVTPTYDNVRRGKQGCRYCAGRGPLDEAVAMAAMRARELEPLEPFRLADAPWLCRCLRCDREVRPRYSSIKMGRGGCRYCGAQHFNYAAPARVYVLAHRELHAVKVGVTGQGKKRIREHQRQGWAVHRVKMLPSGAEALRVERAVIAAWRARGLPPAVSAQAMPQGGWMETVCADEVTPLDAWSAVLAAM